MSEMYLRQPTAPALPGYQKGLASMAYKFFNNKYSGGNISGCAVTRARLHEVCHAKSLVAQDKSVIKNKFTSNKQFPEELHRPLFRQF